MKLPANFSERARKVSFFLHLWLGAVLGLWFSAIGVTGSVLAWMPELVPMEFEAHYPLQKSTSGVSYIPISRAIKAVSQAHPELKAQEKKLVLTPSDHFPHYIFIKSDANNPFEPQPLLIDPYSGQPHPLVRVRDFSVGWIVQFHVSLVSGIKGIVANGVLSALALLVLLSGLRLWWPSTVGQLKNRLRVKRGAKFRRVLLDLHNVLGIYLYGLMFITTLRAVLLVANQLTSNGVSKALDGQIERKPPLVKGRGAKLSDDALVAKVKVAFPGATIESVNRSLQPKDPFSAHLHLREGALGGAEVFIDPYTGAILEKRLESEGTRGRAAKNFMGWAALHFGHFNHLTQVLYTLVGLMPLRLYVTGLLMWWRRLASRKSSQARQKRRERKRFLATAGE